MFNNRRYVTSDISIEIPISLQTIMWEMIDELSIERDYLQVFDITNINIDGERFIKIKHSQEQPEYMNEVLFIIDTDINIDDKIFVIDNGECSTMLFCYEY